MEHERRSVRLRYYDYAAAGAYFVTVCTRRKGLALGRVVDERVELSAIGRAAEEQWLCTAAVRPYVTLDAYVIMPNHLHGIIILGAGRSETSARRQTSAGGDSPVEADPRALLVSTPGHASVPPPAGALWLAEGPAAEPRGPRSGSVGAIIGHFKSAVTRRVASMVGRGAPLWQRNYHEHIIRDDADLWGIRQYILHNPAQWSTDHENPLRVR